MAEEKDVPSGRKPEPCPWLARAQRADIGFGRVHSASISKSSFELQGDWLEYEYNHSCSYEENLVQALNVLMKRLFTNCKNSLVGCVFRALLSWEGYC